MVGEKKAPRCVTCRRPILEGTRVYEVKQGRYQGEVLKSDTVWGYMHPNCFDRSVQTPETILRELREVERRKLEESDRGARAGSATD
jgi:hypothetical protein